MKTAHFSIDDVGLSFRYMHSHKPQTIFDMRLYSTLFRWHKKYGLVANLYCILNIGGFDISNLVDNYQTEFENCSDWLKYGFHSGSAKPFCEDKDYQNSFEKTQVFFKKMRMGYTDTIRLHSWNASDSQEEYLRSKGIKSILMPNEIGYPYDNGIYYKNGILHRRTDLWFEKVPRIDDKSIKMENDFFVMFTHEWCFDDQRTKIEETLKILAASGFCFI